ncbi:MAG TPA: hypothetical protein VIG69_07080 [Candidatus Methylomirabilis sp.]|jgi:hypothetical protein
MAGELTGRRLATLLPVPGFGPEDRINAPRAARPVTFKAAAAGLRPHKLNGDDEPAGLHAMATAEGPRASPSRTRRPPSMGRRSWPSASARSAPRTVGRAERRVTVRALRAEGIARGSEA